MDPHEKQQPKYRYRFGSFEFDPQDPSDYRLFKDGRLCKIRPMQAKLLHVFVRRPKQQIPRDDLILEVWGHKPDPGDKDSVTTSRRNKLYKQVEFLRDAIGQRIKGHKGWYFFDAEVTRVELPEQAPAYEDLTFQWILNARETRRIEVFFLILIGLSSLYLLVYGLFRLLSPARGLPNPELVVSVTQFVVIGCAFLVSLAVFKRDERVFPVTPSKDRAVMEVCGYTDRDQWQEAKKGAKYSLDLYLYYWRVFLLTWTALYLIMIFQNLLTPGPALATLSIANSFFNNFNSLAIALCFVVLEQSTDFGKDGSPPNLARVSRLLAKYGALVIVLVVLVEAAIVVLDGMKKVSPDLATNTIWGLELASAFFGGVALALYVGRIQSKFLGPSTWLPIALYIYVALQPLFVVVNSLNQPFGAALIIEAALVLKCFLFLYVIWLFRSGRFLFYFVRIKKLDESVNPEWKEFFLNLERGVESKSTS